MVLGNGHQNPGQTDHKVLILRILKKILLISMSSFINSQSKLM